MELVLYVAAGGFVTSLIFGIKVAERSKSGYNQGWLHGQAEATSMATFDLVMLIAIAFGLPYLMEDYSGFTWIVGIAGWFIINWLVILGKIKQRE